MITFVCSNLLCTPREAEQITLSELWDLLPKGDETITIPTMAEYLKCRQKSQ